MLDFWFKNWRRSRWYRQPVPAADLVHLEQGLWFFGYLTDEQQERLGKLGRQFIREKSFEGMRNLTVTDNMRWSIAGAACLLLLGFQDHYCFDRVRSLILYPQSIRMPRLANEPEQEYPWVSGLYAREVAVMLSWADAQRDCLNSESIQNVVLHEFAHHIDELDGSVDGNPPLPSRRLTRHWREVARREYQKLFRDWQAGVPLVLDPYGLKDQSEFFAVSVEAFYCLPHEMSAQHPQLYELLQVLFQIDPRQWFQQSVAGPINQPS